MYVCMHVFSVLIDHCNTVCVCVCVCMCVLHTVVTRTFTHIYINEDTRKWKTYCGKP